LSEAAADPGQPRHDPLAALRQSNFVFFIVSRLTYAIGATMLQTAVLWQVYKLTDSPLALGMLGLARLIPSLIFTLPGGAVADRYNRRNILMAAQFAPLTCAIVLAVATLGDWVTVELIYGLTVALGVGAAFEGPARAALLPGIVKPETFSNAVNVNSTVQALAFTSGPAIGGGIIAAAGVGTTYVVFTVLSVIAVVAMSFVKYRQDDSQRRAISLESIAEGIRFVRTRQVLLGAMALDMFAVIFGGVKALLPIYAEDILDSGATGFGFLNASFEAGAFLMSLMLLMRPPVERTGRALILTVMAFGVGTIIFGLSRNFYLSLAVYMVIGATDQISVVMRSTTIQLATPDELRGRVSAVNMVFIQSSNQMNAVVSGGVAALTTATFAVVSGGFGTLATVAAVRLWLPQLWNYRVPRYGEQVAADTRAAVVDAVAEEDSLDVEGAILLPDELPRPNGASSDGGKAPEEASKPGEPAG
jgi:MFS family permease